MLTQFARSDTLSVLRKVTTNELAGLSLHYPFSAECQAGKL